MPEALGTPAAATPPPTGTPAQPSAPTMLSFIGEKGELKEGWRNQLLPEDLRLETVYNKTPDLPSVFKQLAVLDRLVGRKGVVIPTATSKQAEWDVYYEARGRPKTPQDYKLEIPPETADYFDNDLINSARDLFHKRGFNQEDADALWEFEKGRVAAQEKALDDFEEREKSEAESTLRQKWGIAYDENLHLVNRMISENAEEGEQMDYLLAEYGNNPRFAEFLHNIGKKFIEHRIITDVATPSAETESKIDELMGRSLSPDKRTKLPYWDVTHPDHATIVQQVHRLFEEQASRRKGKPA